MCDFCSDSEIVEEMNIGNIRYDLCESCVEDVITVLEKIRYVNDEPPTLFDIRFTIYANDLLRDENNVQE